MTPTRTGPRLQSLVSHKFGRYDGLTEMLEVFLPYSWMAVLSPQPATDREKE